MPAIVTTPAHSTVQQNTLPAGSHRSPPNRGGNRYMDPAHFICGLMRKNTDALGFIPLPTVRDRFVKRGMYVIQTNRFGQPIGYLIHGPVHPDKTLHIHQACIELDRRNRGFGRQAVATLVQRACLAGARTILLRCASDLQSVIFWQTLGFQPTRLAPGGAKRNRSLIHFKLDLD